MASKDEAEFNGVKNINQGRVGGEKGHEILRGNENAGGGNDYSEREIHHYFAEKGRFDFEGARVVDVVRHDA